MHNSNCWGRKQSIFLLLAALLTTVIIPNALAQDYRAKV
jgi:hypothetical protein